MRTSRPNEGTLYRFVLIFVTVVFIDVLVIVYLLCRDKISGSIGLSHENNVVEFLKLVNATYHSVRVLDSLKLEDGNLIEVSDIIAFKQNNTNAEAFRVVEIGYEKGVRSDVRLKLPKDLTSCNIDTRNWQVAKDYIPPQSYYHLVAETIFFCGAIELARNSSAKILMLGLGGGVINGYLHYNFPKMTITVVEISSVMLYLSSKWFGLSLDERHSVVVADGVEFMTEQAQREIKYDAVILDACYSKADRSRLCPSSVFLAEEVVRTMSKIISDKGIMVMNSVPLARSVSEESKLLAERYVGFFRFCNTRDIGTGFGVFYCMHQPGSEEKHVDLLDYVKNSSRL